jgi:hypothetical protein
MVGNKVIPTEWKPTTRPTSCLDEARRLRYAKLHRIRCSRWLSCRHVIVFLHKFKHLSAAILATSSIVSTDTCFASGYDILCPWKLQGHSMWSERIRKNGRELPQLCPGVRLSIVAKFIKNGMDSEIGKRWSFFVFVFLGELSCLPSPVVS